MQSLEVVCFARICSMPHTVSRGSILSASEAAELTSRACYQLTTTIYPANVARRYLPIMFVPVPSKSSDVLHSQLKTWISDPVTNIDVRVRILAAELDRDPIDVVNRFHRLYAEGNVVLLDFSVKTPFTKMAWDLCEAVELLINGDHKKAVPLVEAGIVEAYIAVIKTENFFTLWPVVRRFRHRMLTSTSESVHVYRF